MNISFIIPSFNQGEFIAETIDSVLKIATNSDQIIIADGNSTDQTHAVLKKYEGQKNIIVNIEEDKGFSDCLNKISHLILNPIVGIMSSDDIYVLENAGAIREIFMTSDVGLVYADYEIMDQKGKITGRRIHEESSDILDFLTLRTIIPQSSCFFLSSALKAQMPLDIRFDYVPDVIIFNKIIMHNKYAKINATWSRIRAHKGSRTGVRNPGEQYLKFVSEFLSDSPYYKKALSGGHLLSARYYASSGRRISAVFALNRALSNSFIATINHWLFVRSLLYIILPLRFVDIMKLMKKSR